MSVCVESPPLALPALSAQLSRFEARVPHVPFPIVPVMTVNEVLGRSPDAEIVTGVAVAVSQLSSLVACAKHSTRNTWSLGVNP